jgi:hypothetical protein
VSTSVELRAADESVSSCGSHLESELRRNTVRVRGPISARLKNLFEIPRRLTFQMLKALRQESIQMGLPKSDNQAQFDAFNFPIADPMSQGAVGNLQVEGCFGGSHQVGSH